MRDRTLSVAKLLTPEETAVGPWWDWHETRYMLAMVAVLIFSAVVAYALVGVGLSTLVHLDLSSRLATLAYEPTVPPPAANASEHDVWVFTLEKHNVRIRYVMVWRVLDAQAFERAFRADASSATQRIQHSMDALLRDKAGRLRLINLHDLTDPDTTSSMLQELNAQFREIGVEVSAWRILEVAPRTH